jgi:hypothetical protein
MHRLLFSLFLLVSMAPALYCAQSKPCQLIKDSVNADALADQLALVRLEASERYRHYITTQVNAAPADAVAALAVQEPTGIKRERSNSLIEMQALASKADATQSELTSVNKHFYRLLTTVIEQGFDDLASMALQHPAIDINWQDRDGATLLICAAGNSRTAIVKILLTHVDIDINRATLAGETALIFAKTYAKPCDRAEIIRLLEARGAR